MDKLSFMNYTLQIRKVLRTGCTIPVAQTWGKVKRTFSFLFNRKIAKQLMNGWTDGQSQSKSSEDATKNDAVDEVKESNHNKDLD